MVVRSVPGMIVLAAPDTAVQAVFDRLDLVVPDRFVLDTQVQSSVRDRLAEGDTAFRIDTVQDNLVVHNRVDKAVLYIESVEFAVRLQENQALSQSVAAG